MQIQHLKSDFYKLVQITQELMTLNKDGPGQVFVLTLFLNGHIEKEKKNRITR